MASAWVVRGFASQLLRTCKYTGTMQQARTIAPIYSITKRLCCHHQGEIMSKVQIQKPSPPFSGTAINPNGEFIDLKLSDYKGKYCVLFFYPLDFTFVCPTEIIAFSDRVEEFRAINCEVIACSVDSEFSHLAWTNLPRKKGGLGKMKIPILSDLTKQISKDYGVLLEDQGVSLRGLFIIDDKGILRQITMNDLPVGRSVDETLRLVQAFQFTDKHGEDLAVSILMLNYCGYWLPEITEKLKMPGSQITQNNLHSSARVCPAGWRPGSDTIVPEPRKSEAYFSKQ